MCFLFSCRFTDESFLKTVEFMIHPFDWPLVYMLQVQMFVCVLAVVAITLAAIVHDRKGMERELNEMNSTLEDQVVNVLHSQLQLKNDHSTCNKRI